MIVGFDDPLSEAMLEELKAIPGMTSVKVVTQEASGPQQPRMRGV